MLQKIIIIKEQLNGEKWDIELGYVSASYKAMLFSCPVLGRMYNIVIYHRFTLFYFSFWSIYNIVIYHRLTLLYFSFWSIYNIVIYHRLTLLYFNFWSIYNIVIYHRLTLLYFNLLPTLFFTSSFFIILYLSSTPDEDYEWKALLFLTVLYVPPDR